MTAVTQIAEAITDAFARAEHTMDHKPGLHRDVALAAFTVRYLADPANAGAAQIIEGLDRIHAQLATITARAAS